MYYYYYYYFLSIPRMDALTFFASCPIELLNYLLYFLNSSILDIIRFIKCSKRVYLRVSNAKTIWNCLNRMQPKCIFTGKPEPLKRTLLFKEIYPKIVNDLLSKRNTLLVGSELIFENRIAAAFTDACKDTQARIIPKNFGEFKQMLSNAYYLKSSTVFLDKVEWSPMILKFEIEKFELKISNPNDGFYEQYITVKAMTKCSNVVSSSSSSSSPWKKIATFSYNNMYGLLTEIAIGLGIIEKPGMNMLINNASWKYNSTNRIMFYHEKYNVSSNVFGNYFSASDEMKTILKKDLFPNISHMFKSKEQILNEIQNMQVNFVIYIPSTVRTCLDSIFNFFILKHYFPLNIESFKELLLLRLSGLEFLLREEFECLFEHYTLSLHM